MAWVEDDRSSTYTITLSTAPPAAKPNWWIWLAVVGAMVGGHTYLAYKK